VCGPGEEQGLASAVTALASATGYPILADPLSGLRFGDHDRANVIDAYDPFLRCQEIASALSPDLVLRTGAEPTSKPLQQFLLANPAPHHILFDAGEPRDPSHLGTPVIPAAVVATLTAIHERVETAPTAHAAWLDRWRTIAQTARAAIDAALAGDDALFEGRAVAEIAALLPDGGTLVVGNSMPIRDVDAFVRGDQRRLRILGNRGANGIDGLNSSALGAAAVADGPVVLVVGDLSFFHDLTGLAAAQRFGLNLTVVVLNNDGGGIFSFLPQAEQLDVATFEALFGTPIELDIGAAARLYAASHAKPATWHAFRRDFCRGIDDPGLSIVEVVTDREQNVAQHRAVWSAVAAALQPLLATGA
jgi:2-succinyl-5-enolpyruvyl-6-hydroxy-3-cyclohexene-1-carboxylate synthase